jgi:ABC-type Mn2+/Zn2+ transport system permease subunit
MQSWDYLFGPFATMRPAAFAALAVSLLCGLLSPLVVLRRMAFIGQGISHAAFGGVGVAAILGLFAAGATAAQTLGAYAVVALFCIAAALAIAWLSRTPDLSEDTAIGVLLVASMALGFLLLQLQRGRGGASISVEGFLFGQVATAGALEAGFAWGVLGMAVGVLWLLRRPLLFWAFDEPMAESLGVRVDWVRSVLLTLLAVTVVITMQLAGVILATAMLVLPGATALQLSTRLTPVVASSVGIGAVGGILGLLLSFELDGPPGPSIALVYVGLFVVARAFKGVLGRRAAR